jgi:CheY-like chemotaxis protein
VGVVQREVKRPLVLVAEDLGDARDLMRICLELEGFDVIVAANGVEAVARARASIPDAVVMDLSLPGLDGFQATEAIKRDSRTCQIPVLAYSGHAFPGDVARARLAGCDTLLPKPCKPKVMATRIRALLDDSKARR